MEKFVEQSLLYDFYGELLTEHQRRIYEDYVLNDLSLAEIASCEGISRQGVHDMVKRCNRTLADYEEKLHLVEKFLAVKEKVGMISKLVESVDPELKTGDAKRVFEEIETYADQILEEL